MIYMGGEEVMRHEHDQELIKSLKERAKVLRKTALRIMKNVPIAWLGGSFSMADIVTALYYHHMRHDPKNPNWRERDRLIVSKAHCCEIVYAVLAELGYFPKEELSRYGRVGALLQIHTDRHVPGVEYSGGFLGQGISFAIGQALAAKIDKLNYRVYCILGDGECNEGQVWEAAMFASHYKVDNLTVLLDYNKYQSTGPVAEKMNMEPLGKKWEAFGWHVVEIDGHNMKEILDTLDEVEEVKGKPHMIICHTIMAKGIPFLEGKHVHHIENMDDEMYEVLLKALEGETVEVRDDLLSKFLGGGRKLD